MLRSKHICRMTRYDKKLTKNWQGMKTIGQIWTNCSAKKNKSHRAGGNFSGKPWGGNLYGTSGLKHPETEATDTLHITVQWAEVHLSRSDFDIRRIHTSCTHHRLRANLFSQTQAQRSDSHGAYSYIRPAWHKAPIDLYNCCDRLFLTGLHHDFAQLLSLFPWSPKCMLVLVCLSQLLTLSSGNQMRPCWWLPSSVSSTPMPSHSTKRTETQTWTKKGRGENCKGWWRDVALCLAYSGIVWLCDRGTMAPEFRAVHWNEISRESNQRISIVQQSHESNEVSCSTSNSKCGFSLGVQRLPWNGRAKQSCHWFIQFIQRAKCDFLITTWGTLSKFVGPTFINFHQLPSTSVNFPLFRSNCLIVSNRVQPCPTVSNSQPGRHFASSATKLWRRRAWPPSHGLVTMFTPCSLEIHCHCDQCDVCFGWFGLVTSHCDSTATICSKWSPT